MAYRNVAADAGGGLVSNRAGSSSDVALLTLADLADRCLDGADCLYDRSLHDGPDDPAAETTAEQLAREQVAAEVCAACLVREPCLEYALLTRPARGVWAGLTDSEIAVVAETLAGGQPEAKRVTR